MSFDQVFNYDEIILKLRSDKANFEEKIIKAEECATCTNELLQNPKFESILKDHKNQCCRQVDLFKSKIAEIDLIITKIEELLALADEQKDILLKFKKYSGKDWDDSENIQLPEQTDISQKFKQINFLGESAKSMYMGIIAKNHAEMIVDERIIHLLSDEDMSDDMKKQVGLLVMANYPVPQLFFF